MSENPEISGQNSAGGSNPVNLKSKLIIAFLLIVIIWGIFFSVLFQYLLQRILKEEKIPEDILAKILSQFTLSVTGMTILGGIVVLYVAYHFSLKIAGPIADLTTGVEEIAHGNFQARVKVETADELGILAQSFNKMSEELQKQKETLLEQQRLLEEKNKSLEEANRHKSEFLANMSHEIRTPLNAMIGYTNLSLRQLRDKIPLENLQHLTSAEQSAKVLLCIISDILDFSKIEAGKMDIYIETFSLKGIMEECMVTAKGQAFQKNIEFLPDMPEELPTIESDEIKIKQILNNLLSNALKFTEAKGFVFLRVMDRSPGGYLMVQVEDTGCGIPEDKLGNLFESFRQADSSIRKRFGGTGLGLAITKRFCDMLGISISAESRLGKGTTFSLTIPLKYRENRDS